MANPKTRVGESRVPARASREGWHGWDAYAPFYDWENAQTLGRRDIPFWRRIASAADGTVLELGCGTGRVSVPLAKAGVDLVGIDRSAPMLERARERAARANRNHSALRAPQWIRGDIRALPFRTHAFAMVLAPYGILQSLIRARDLAATIASVARVLEPGGTFGIDLVPDVPKWKEYRNRVQLRGESNGAQLTLIESVTQDRRRRLTTASLRPHVPYPVGAADGLAARARRLHRRRRARRLPGTAVGRARGRVDHPGEKGVKFAAMSGHSKWHSIKHKKGAADAKRGKIFTRLIKELTVAARAGGGDPDMNPRLRTIIAEAKSQNMPAENIKRAVRRGTGEEPGVAYEEAQYEAYGPGGAALIIDVLTDNKNRTVGELRHTLEKHGGNLASTNAVAWMFHKKGYIVIEKTKADEEKLMSAVLDAGADDLQDDEDNWEVFSTPDAFPAVSEAVKALGIEPATAKVQMIPQNYVKLEGKPAQQMVKLMEALDDHDDVQNVSSNFDISEKEIEASLA